MNEAELQDQWSGAIVAALRAKVAAGEVDADTAAIAGIYAAYNLACDAGFSKKGAFDYMRQALRRMERHAVKR